MPDHLLQADRESGADAVCFTAGPQGLHFGAGVIHAYLAADRESPKVAAGISTGALNAAAMYKVYRDLKKASADPEVRETARWDWFRQFLVDIVVDPFSPIWEAIPNPVDFFAETRPVEDLSCPKELKEKETEFRDQYFRLVRLGVWLAGCPVTVGDVTDLIVRWVRWKENYAGPWYQLGAFLWRAAKVSFVLLGQIAFHPAISWRRLVCRDGSSEREFAPMPLFGYSIWLGAVLAVVSGPLALLLTWFFGWHWATFWIVFAASALLSFNLIWKNVLVPLRLNRNLVHTYPLERWLFERFGDLEIKTPEKGGPMHLLVVAATVNRLGRESGSSQLWAKADSGAKVRDAILAGYAKAPFYPAVRPEDPGHWLDADGLRALHGNPLLLVDGAVVGANPMPSFFQWADRNWKRPGCRGAIEALETSANRLGAALRVVYSVPIATLSRQNAVPRESLNIVENGFTSLSMQRRRDTEMESAQTHFISELESKVRESGGVRKNPDVVKWQIFPLPISPEVEIGYGNDLAPTRDEGLTQIAHGCRRTLESIYRHRLVEIGNPQAAEVDCVRLLADVAKERHGAGFVRLEAPGLPEVCRKCSGKLQRRPVENSNIDQVVPSYGKPLGSKVHESFPVLAGAEAKSRVVFLANGGVFRGSFHLGVAAGMHVAGLKPDLVVGSSVGAIIGAAVCAMQHHGNPRAYLAQVANVFLHCDEKVALTRGFKNAAKQLGIRGKSIDLSPNDIRQMVREGSRRDPSYAIAGAPPELIDALSDLFLLPHHTTQQIAATFVSGHITEAVNAFWKAVQGDTLTRLGIVECVIGSELLQQTAKQLLFPTNSCDANTVQPFLPKGGPAFFATTTHLNRRGTLLLGRDFPEELPAPVKYDFVESCLSSSAFPVVFAPRPASNLLPGLGRTDTLLSDGGIFDNLPFFPAINVLSDMQVSHGTGQPGAVERLKTRHAHPVMMIAAGLDCNAYFEDSPKDDMMSLHDLSSAMGNNVKIRSFEWTGKLTSAMVADLLRGDCSKIPARFLDKVVVANVLKILPSAPDHLNGTFHFCHAVGFKEKRMHRSIAHGCFRTLLSLTAKGDPAMEGWRRDGLFQEIARRDRKSDVAEGECPYFLSGGKPVECPFSQPGNKEMVQIYEACKGSPVHAAEIKSSADAACETPSAPETPLQRAATNSR